MINKNEKSDYPFMKFPRALTENPQFFHISIEARTLFMMILDRFGLSAINDDKFTDESGELFIIFTVEEVCEKFGCGKDKVIRIFRELENNGLIIRKRKISCMPYKIYLTERFFRLAESEFPTAENPTSGSTETRVPKLAKPEHIKNKNIKNDNSNNNPSIIGFGRTEDEIREQIEYECLVCDENKKLLDEIVMIISDVLNGTSPTVRIGRDDMPRGIVVSRFCKLDSEHIVSVIYDLEHGKTEIRNIKQYLITMLYNAPATSECYAAAEFSFHRKS